MSELKKAWRDVETGVKETGREIDGHQPKDDLGNAGDEARRDLGNLGDDVRQGVRDPGDRGIDDPDQVDRERPVD